MMRRAAGPGRRLGVDAMNAIKALALAQAKGGRLEVEALSVSQNGVYTADEGKAYSPVTVDEIGRAHV